MDEDMSQRRKIKTIILACSIAAITATGTLYGAGLKTSQEIKEVSTTRATFYHIDGFIGYISNIYTLSRL